MHAEERQHECSQRRSEVRAGRLSSRFRLRAYRTVQTRPVSSRSVHHGIFPDVYFYTHSLQRPHERRPMASRREQVSALFFVAWTQRRLTECFPWATEGPNPPKETLTFKKEFFWQTTSGSLPAGLKTIAAASLVYVCSPKTRNLFKITDRIYRTKQVFIWAVVTHRFPSDHWCQAPSSGVSTRMGDHAGTPRVVAWCTRYT